MSNPTKPTETLPELMNTIALSLVTKHNLRTNLDEIVCWNCKGRIAVMPHLHCNQCYEDWKERNGRA